MLIIMVLGSPSTLFLAMAKIGMKVNFALSQRHFIPNRSHLSENGLRKAPDFYRMLPKRKTVKKSHDIYTVFQLLFAVCGMALLFACFFWLK